MRKALLGPLLAAMLFGILVVPASEKSVNWEGQAVNWNSIAKKNG